MASPSWTKIGSDITGLNFGFKSISINYDGSIVAFGNGSFNSVVKVYKKNTNNTWSQYGSDINGIKIDDAFGVSISLNSDGNIITIGGQNGDQVSPAKTDVGYVNVYQYNVSSSSWIILGQTIYGESAGDRFGRTVSLSADGYTFAASSPDNDGGGVDYGSVRVYNFNNTSWVKLGQDIDHNEFTSYFGSSLSLSKDGQVVAIGSETYSSGTNYSKGKVIVYKYNSSTLVWNIYGSVFIGNLLYSYLGSSVSLNQNGTILAIGEKGFSSHTGRVMVYKYTNGWVQYGSSLVGLSNADSFGYSVSLNNEGNILSIVSKESDNPSNGMGNVDVYQYFSDTNTWINLGNKIYSIYPYYIHSSVLSGDGKTVCVGLSHAMSIFNFLKLNTILTNFTLGGNSIRTYGGAPFPLVDPSSNRTGTFSYTSSNSSVATITNNIVTILSAGTTIITATQTETNNYNSASIETTLTVNKITTILNKFTLGINSTKTYGDASFTLVDPSSNRPGTITYTSSKPSVATISGSTVTILNAGTTDISASQTETDIYTAASISATLTVNKITTVLNNFTLGENSTKIYGDAPFTLVDPSSNRHGTFQYTTTNPSVATIVGNVVTIQNAGTTDISASLDASTNYTAASISATLTVNKQATTLTALSVPIVFRDETPSFTLTNPLSSRTGIFPLTYSSSNPSVATIAGNVVTIRAAGTTDISAIQDESFNYLKGTTQATLMVNERYDTMFMTNDVSLNKYYHVFFQMDASNIMTSYLYDNSINLISTKGYTFGLNGYSISDVLTVLDQSGANPYVIGVDNAGLQYNSMDLGFFGIYKSKLSLNRQQSMMKYVNSKYKEPHTDASLCVVTVVDGSFYINGVINGSIPKINGDYLFDQSDPSNDGNPFRISATFNGTFAGGTEYGTDLVTNGTPGSINAYTWIRVSGSTPTLYYYSANTNSMSSILFS